MLIGLWRTKFIFLSLLNGIGMKIIMVWRMRGWRRVDENPCFVGFLREKERNLSSLLERLEK